MKSSLFILLVFLSLIGALNASTSMAQFNAGGAPPSATAPVWGKLVVSGNTVTCYYALGANTPTSWIQLGQPENINFQNNPILVGLCLSAHNSAAIAAGTIDNFSITPTPLYRLQDYDVGQPTLMGSANLVKGVWNMTASGVDLWGTSDQCNFQPWLVWGDFTVVCRVTSVSVSGNMWEKIGIMVRDGYNSGSDCAMFCATNGKGNLFQYRPDFLVNPDGATVATLVAPSSNGSGTAIGVDPLGSSTTIFTLRP